MKHPLTISFEKEDYIIQPNHITNAKYDYSLLQERIFSSIVFRLQELILQNLKNNIFHPQEQRFETVKIMILMAEIGVKPNNYDHLRKAIKQMSLLPIEIPFKREGKQWLRITNFFDVELPKQGDYSSSIIIEMKKETARLLIEIEKNKYGKPVSFTKFSYAVAMSSKSKYTSRIYKILASWRKKGSFVISVEDLREQLGLKSKYVLYKDFKKNVLLPAFKELEQNNDCWFDINAKNFEIKKGKEVTHLDFTVITPESVEAAKKKAEGIRDILRNHFKFRDNDFEEISSILNDKNIAPGAIIHKIVQVHQGMNSSAVSNKKNYMIRSLQNEFKGLLK